MFFDKTFLIAAFGAGAVCLGLLIVLYTVDWFRKWWTQKPSRHSLVMPCQASAACGKTATAQHWHPSHGYIPMCKQCATYTYLGYVMTVFMFLCLLYLIKELTPL